MLKRKTILFSCLCLPNIGLYSQGSELLADFQKANIVSKGGASRNGTKIINLLKRKRKRKSNYDLALKKLELNVEYMSDDSEDEEDFNNREPNFNDEIDENNLIFFESIDKLKKFYRSVSHNLSSRRKALIEENKLQHHILSRLYEMIEPIYKSKSAVPTSYSFIISSPFGNLTLALRRCKKDDEHSFYLENDIEKFYAFQTFVSHGRLKSDYESLENEFNSMNLSKRKKAIHIIYEYLNLKCNGFDFKTKRLCSETGHNSITFSCINKAFIGLIDYANKIFNKKELSCLRTITAILGFSEPLRIHDGGKTMRALFRYNKIIFTS